MEVFQMKKTGSMEKSIVVISFAASLLLLSGCGKVTPEAEEEHYVVLGAEMSKEPETKINFIQSSGDNTKAIFGWQMSDAIGVSVEGSETFSKLTITDSQYTGDGWYKTLFGGSIPGELGDYAVYPYNEGHKLSGNVLTYCLPSEYTYTSVDSDYYGAVNSANPPALGAISKLSEDNITTELKHLGGVLCIKVDKMPAESGSVSLSSDRQICGNFTLTLDGMTSNYALFSTSTSDSDKTVTIKYSGATEGESGVFFFPMPYCDVDSKMKVSVSINGEHTKSGSTLVTSYTVSDKSISVGLSEIKPIKITTNYSYYVEGHKFVDLGLPSGLLWAETNLGASSAAYCGDYYAWAEIETLNENKTSFSWSSYKYGTGSSDIKKYYPIVDDKTTLEMEDDAAYVNWGAWCRMPSRDEFQDLYDKCTWTPESRDDVQHTSRGGFKVTGPNGNSIYLPAEFGYVSETGKQEYGSFGYYWSSTSPASGNTQCAYYLQIGKNHYRGVSENPQRSRYQGLQIRAVVAR